VIEFTGWTSWQWLSPCTYDLAPPCQGAAPPAGMTNAASYRYAALRVVNATTDTLLAAFRPPSAGPTPSATNWTEVYDVSADPFQMTNLAVRGRLPPSQLAAMTAELWQVANCVGSTCP